MVRGSHAGQANPSEIEAHSDRIHKRESNAPTTLASAYTCVPTDTYRIGNISLDYGGAALHKIVLRRIIAGQPASQTL